MSHSEGAQLQGRVAVISGGAHGIGKAIAGLFQAQGASVCILDCDREAGLETARELSNLHAMGKTTFIAADVRDQVSVLAAIERVKTDTGRIDILVNNAGIELDKPFEQLSLREWDCVLGVNLGGAFLLTQAALPLFPKQGGAIINISSIHSTHAFPNSLPYACSKAGLIAFTRNLALELAPRHIRVNAICPGYIDTRLWDEYLRHAPNAEQLARQTSELHPVGRRGSVADVAAAVLFLASDAASFVTGTDLVVDGGLTIRAHP